MSKSAQLVSSSNIDEKQVVEFLNCNPDFFRNHPGILANMALPHNSGGAVSLVERQVAILRERSIETRHKLGELVANAKENDRLFEKTQTLVLGLLNSTSVDQAADIIKSAFKREFNVESVGLLLISAEGSGTLQNSIRTSTTIQAEEQIESLLQAKRSSCGALRQKEASFIFGDTPTPVSSAAVAIRKLETANSCQLLIAVGHQDGSHYGTDTGTLFLDYIADILQLVLQRLMKG